MRTVQLEEQPKCDICTTILGKDPDFANDAVYDAQVNVNGWSGGAYICEEHKGYATRIYCMVTAGENPEDESFNNMRDKRGKTIKEVLK